MQPTADAPLLRRTLDWDSSEWVCVWKENSAQKDPKKEATLATCLDCKSRKISVLIYRIAVPIFDSHFGDKKPVPSLEGISNFWYVIFATSRPISSRQKC